MMFEEGDLIEMQPNLAVNKPACKHLPEFALKGQMQGLVSRFPRDELKDGIS
jgi:hypothetical protein